MSKKKDRKRKIKSIKALLAQALMDLIVGIILLIIGKLLNM